MCIRCGTEGKKHRDFVALTKYLYLITSRNNYQSVCKKLIGLFKILIGQIQLKCTREKWLENFPVLFPYISNQKIYKSQMLQDKFK